MPVFDRFIQNKTSKVKTKPKINRYTALEFSDSVYSILRNDNFHRDERAKTDLALTRNFLFFIPSVSKLNYISFPLQKFHGLENEKRL